MQIEEMLSGANIGLAIKVLRNDNNHSQERASQLLGCDRSWISKIESGENNNISFEFFLRLCVVYDRTPSLMCDLMGIKIH